MISRISIDKVKLSKLGGLHSYLADMGRVIFGKVNKECKATRCRHNGQSG